MHVAQSVGTSVTYRRLYLLVAAAVVATNLACGVQPTGPRQPVTPVAGPTLSSESQPPPVCEPVAATLVRTTRLYSGSAAGAGVLGERPEGTPVQVAYVSGNRLHIFEQGDPNK